VHNYEVYYSETCRTGFKGIAQKHKSASQAHLTADFTGLSRHVDGMIRTSWSDGTYPTHFVVHGVDPKSLKVQGQSRSMRVTRI
jgi:hypothetical protein